MYVIEIVMEMTSLHSTTVCVMHSFAMEMNMHDIMQVIL